MYKRDYTYVKYPDLHSARGVSSHNRFTPGASSAVYRSGGWGGANHRIMRRFLDFFGWMAKATIFGFFLLTGQNLQKQGKSPAQNLRKSLEEHASPPAPPPPYSNAPALQSVLILLETLKTTPRYTEKLANRSSKHLQKQPPRH